MGGDEVDSTVFVAEARPVPMEASAACSLSGSPVNSCMTIPDVVKISRALRPARKSIDLQSCRIARMRSAGAKWRSSKR